MQSHAFWTPVLLVLTLVPLVFREWVAIRYFNDLSRAVESVVDISPNSGGGSDEPTTDSPRDLSEYVGKPLHVSGNIHSVLQRPRRDSARNYQPPECHEGSEGYDLVKDPLLSGHPGCDILLFIHLLISLSLIA